MCEIEPYARAVLGKHWPGVPIFDDVRTLKAADLPAKIDVITGGFPCQDISLAGKGAGITGARSGLWVEMFRVISEVRPSWVVVENVSALRSRGLEQVLWALASIGYDAEWHCIPASAVGAPHRRDRVWIVAYPQANAQRPDADRLRPHLASLYEHGGSELRDQQVGDTGPLRSDVAHTARVLEGWPQQRAVGERVGEGGQSVAAPDPFSLDGGQGRTRGPDPSGSRQHVAERPLQKPVVHADNQGSLPTALAGVRGSQEGAGSRDGELERPSEEWALADAHHTRLEIGQQGDAGQQPALVGGSWWIVEPNVGRVANGIPKRVDRLKGLGNAVVPQIPEMIAHAIKRARTS